MHHAEDLVVGLALRQSGGQAMSSSVVWKNSLPPASLWPVLARSMPAWVSIAPLAAVKVASASSSRLTWRALRATSLMPFLCCRVPPA
jgi:hypothetical protein